MYAFILQHQFQLSNVIQMVHQQNLPDIFNLEFTYFCVRWFSFVIGQL